MDPTDSVLGERLPTARLGDALREPLAPHGLGRKFARSPLGARLAILAPPLKAVGSTAVSVEVTSPTVTRTPAAVLEIVHATEP